MAPRHVSHTEDTPRAGKPEGSAAGEGGGRQAAGATHRGSCARPAKGSCRPRPEAWCVCVCVCQWVRDKQRKSRSAAAMTPRRSTSCDHSRSEAARRYWRGGRRRGRKAVWRGRALGAVCRREKEWSASLLFATRETVHSRTHTHTHVHTHTDTHAHTHIHTLSLLNIA